MNLTINLGGGYFASIFTKDPNVAAYIFLRMKYVLLFQWIASSYEVTGSALRGYGYSLTPALLTVFGTVVIRIAWVLTVHVRFHSFTALMLVYPFSWVVTGIMVIGAYIIITRKIEKAMSTA